MKTQKKIVSVFARIEMHEFSEAKEQPLKIEKFDLSKYDVKRIKSTKKANYDNKLDLFKHEGSLKDVRHDPVRHFGSKRDIKDFEIPDFKKKSEFEPKKNDSKEKKEEVPIEDLKIEMKFEDKPRILTEKSIYSYIV